MVLGAGFLSSGTIVPITASINAGTAGVQQLFALLYDCSGWDYAVSSDGLFTSYSNFFGHPFDYAIEPVTPQNLEQPVMQLPFEPEVDWAFTGGPHGNGETVLHGRRLILLQEAKAWDALKVIYGLWRLQMG